MGLTASGNVHHEREFLWYAKLGDQPFQRLTQVSHRRLGGITLTVRADARTQLRVSAEHTVFVLFQGVGNVYGLRHGPRLPWIGLSIVTWLAETLESCLANVVHSPLAALSSIWRQPERSLRASAVCDEPSGRKTRSVISKCDADYSEYVELRLPALRRLALLLCQDRHRADDLVQQAVIRVYVHWAKASAADNTDAYVNAILVREFLHERRSSWTRRVRVTDQVPDAPILTADRDRLMDLQAAVAALPAGQRAALVLRYYCDLNIDQTAAALGCSTGTVKSQTAKAIAALRCRLDGEATITTAGRQAQAPMRRRAGKGPRRA
jgi:RNA polymerase sigma-70 factor (sigma-E family)